MTSAEIERLFDQTLTGDSEDESAWEAIHALRSNGCRETFDIAAEWIKSEEPKKRARAADVLAQIRDRPEMIPIFQDEAYSLITELLESESEPLVLNSGVSALGHLHNEAAIPTIMRYVNHPNPDVRFGAAFALGCFPNDVLAIPGLLLLTRDEEADVRDWAVFGLGVQGDTDSVDIREALLKCLSDPNEDVREEAAVGLGKRRDLRLLPDLRRMLDAPNPSVRVTDAASALLGLPQKPPEWEAQDYKDALDKQFPILSTELSD
jgi:HEAT repeat protein